MKFGEGMNHLARSVGDIERALITGGTITARCGAVLTPELRVGSSGRANDPALPRCPICARISELESTRSQIEAEIGALYERALIATAEDAPHSNIHRSIEPRKVVQ